MNEGESGENPGQYPLLYRSSDISLGHCEETHGKAEYHVRALSQNTRFQTNLKGYGSITGCISSLFQSLLNT